jgi:O-acetyl-ADP-ribose deacetylase (regulator of RNase III)
MRFHLRDRNAAMVKAWREFFRDNPDFIVDQGHIFENTKADAIVSPANSFGFMDGGIDAVYEMRFGAQVPQKLRDHIKVEWHGEIPVGQAAIIATDYPDFPYLICAPTMRIPEKVANTVNAYLAFRAVLLLVKKWNLGGEKIRSILCPGLGTAVGEMSPWNCAKQMHYAYEAIWLGKPIDPTGLGDAYWHQMELKGKPSGWDAIV